jgi:hypothetical protein
MNRYNLSKFYIRTSFIRQDSYNYKIQKLIKHVNNNLGQPKKNKNFYELLGQKLHLLPGHIDNIEIKINNPKKININSIFSKYLYSVKIYIIKDNIFLIKTIEDNDFEKVLNETNNFINNKINI